MVAPAGASAATGSISGTVSDAGTEAGTEGIEVCAYSFEFEEQPPCAETASDGTYTIEELEPGKYEIEFWPGSQTYAVQFYDGKSNPWEADLVPVGSGAAVTEIDAALIKAARMEGTVTEAAGGAPVEEVLVCVYGIGEAEVERCAWTDANGEYGISSLPGGAYKVEFWSGETGLNLATQFYDHRYEWSQADVVTLTTATVKSGIDAQLDAGAEFSGTVFAASTGLPLRGILVCSVRAAAGTLSSCTETNSAGRYWLERLPPGSYKAAFSLEFREFFPGEEPENDGFLTQFWNQKASLAEANAFSLATGGVAAGIDAHLLTPGVATPPVIIPAVTKPAVHKPKPKPKHCKPGFRRKKIHGMVRCVRPHKHRHRHRHKGALAAGRLGSRSPELLRLLRR
jgi:hypothetical protein